MPLSSAEFLDFWRWPHFTTIAGGSVISRWWGRESRKFGKFIAYARTGGGGGELESVQHRRVQGGGGRGQKKYFLDGPLREGIYSKFIQVSQRIFPADLAPEHVQNMFKRRNSCRQRINSILKIIT